MDGTPSKGLFPRHSPLGRRGKSREKRNIVSFPLKDDIDFFGEKERKEHRGWRNNILRGTRGIEEKFWREREDTDEDEAFSNFSLYPFIPTSSAGTRQ